MTFLAKSTHRLIVFDYVYTLCSLSTLVESVHPWFDRYNSNQRWSYRQLACQVYVYLGLLWPRAQDRRDAVFYDSA